MFHYIERSDRILVWLNTLCLMTVSFFPFPAEFIGRYPRQQVAIILYAGTLLLMGLSLLAVWIYASRHHRLIHPKLDPKFIRLGKWYILGGPFVYLLAIGLSFVSIYVSLAILIITPILYLLPSPIDRFAGRIPLDPGLPLE